MRNFKRWYRLQLYCFGRWLMQRYQKPLVFQDLVNQYDNLERHEIGSAMCAMLARRPVYEKVKVPADKVLELVEGQPGEQVEPPHMSLLHLGPDEEVV